MNDAANDESEGVNSVLLIIVEFNGKGPTYGGKGRSQGCYKLWSDSDTLQAPKAHLSFRFWSSGPEQQETSLQRRVAEEAHSMHTNH
ncbi:hypothetical protein P5673_005318 [Acropora cervicornis]|uniref:Uncharacterized protein n=1 Tax=Acropora cervicornis TaxID=6130 RepID=A0AAD9QZU7_ACRCE|nr:hypothetical protein P5673_005318 [Acropora cervicornis]